MEKVRNMRFLGIVGVIIAVLFLVSISVTQSQVSIQGKPDQTGKKPKPDDPPDDPPATATWAVSIPQVEGTMLYGDGLMYDNNNADVRIKVEKNNSMVRVNGKRELVYYYYFSFKLLNPTGRYAGFQNVVLNPGEYPDGGPYCIFPGDEGFTCMQTFLNQPHPHPAYEYFNLKFQVGQYSFEQALGSTEGLEDMPIDVNVPVKFVGYSDWIKIRVENQVDFTDPSTEFHNIECNERNYHDEIFDNMNIWIERLEENRWRISVVGANLLLQEQYTQRVATGKGNKTKTVTAVPYEAKGNFTFYIDFIKITN